MRRQSKLFRLLPALGVSLALALLLGPVAAWAAGFTNGSFESFQSYNGQTWRGFPERYGQDWTLAVPGGQDRLHFMDSDTFGRFIAAVYGQPYLNYHLEGSLAQAAASQYAFNFVLSQTVTVQPGQAYAFGGKIVTFWKGSGPPVDHTQIAKRIGLDPSGGTAWDGPGVVWTDWDATDNAWISPALAGMAEGDRMTVFIQLENKTPDVGSAYLNTAFIDSFKFEPAPTVNLNLPDTVLSGPVQVSWQAVINSPWTLWGYDVQYREEPAGPWQTVQIHDGQGRANESYTLSNVQPGQTYTFRVRPWQQWGSGDATVTALPGLWTEKSVAVSDQAITGRVMNHAGLAQAGVTVTASGIVTPAVSDATGAYLLPVGAEGTFDVAATDFNGLVAPPAGSVTVTPAGPGHLTIVLRPAGQDQGLADNDFEGVPAAWQAGGGGTVSLSSTESHTGDKSLRLTPGASARQVGSVSGMHSPLLSFWYKGDAPLTVEFLGPEENPLWQRSLEPAAAWTYARLESGLGEVYTGTVGVNLANQAGSGDIFIDEASIGPGPGSKVYLPVILLNSSQN